MKQIGILLCIYFFGILPLFSQNIDIPDQCFIDELIADGVDTNEDGLISYAEAEAVERLDIWSECISDIRGIEAFLNLTHFRCSSVKLKKVDLSSNSKLSHLSIFGQFDTLDLSHNPLVDSLWCYGSAISTLDVSRCENLIFLNARWNLLTHLDLSKNKNLENLICSGNQLTELDLSACPKLHRLDCSENLITHLNLIGNKNLYRLICEHNQLRNLDLSDLDSLANLGCSHNLLNTLDLSQNPELSFLGCSSNRLNYLDASMNLNLQVLHCGSNPMYTLNISNNWALDSVGFGYGTVELGIDHMPSLRQVCVWTLPFPPEGLKMDTIGSPNITFTMECVIGGKEEQTPEPAIYPNPTNGQLWIRAGTSEPYEVLITSTSGQLLQRESFRVEESRMDISSFSKGIYIVSIRSTHRVFTEKVIKH